MNGPPVASQASLLPGIVARHPQYFQDIALHESAHKGPGSADARAALEQAKEEYLWEKHTNHADLGQQLTERLEAFLTGLLTGPTRRACVCIRCHAALVVP